MLYWMVSIHSNECASLHQRLFITILILIFSMFLEMSHKIYKVYGGKRVLKRKLRELKKKSETLNGPSCFTCSNTSHSDG